MGCQKNKREVAKEPKRAPKFGFFEPKNQKRAPKLGFFCKKSQRQPDFWQKSFWILPPPSVWTPRHKIPAAWTYMPEITFLLEPLSFFLESNFELSLLKPKFWEILPLKIKKFAPRFPMLVLHSVQFSSNQFANWFDFGPQPVCSSVFYTNQLQTGSNWFETGLTKQFASFVIL